MLRHLFAIPALLLPQIALAAEPQAAVQALGRLNGVALQCRFVDEVRRMKAAVVANAPKERRYGLAFDQATNDEFLAFTTARRSCPGPAAFAIRVDAAVRDLEQAFATRRNDSGAQPSQ